MAIILVTTADLEAARQVQSALEPDDRVQVVSGTGEARAVLDALEGETALILTGAMEEEPTRALVAEALEVSPQTPVIALCGEEDAVTVELMAEFGVDEFFTKPVDADEIAIAVHRLIRWKHLQTELGIVGKSAAIQEVVESIAQIAPVGSTVLITGESGTGKELVARGLHKLSTRRGKPFIAVNIAALPETLLESEMFGHEKGAFTGASSLRKGMFELANGGTIFLDEIAEMSSGPQTRLLRVLEQREFMRVGGSSSIRVDVRVIAATNSDLRHAVELGEFRRDLYYRLNVLRIHMPPLRERCEDIPLLVHEFIRELSREHQKEFKGIAPDAMQILVRYDWPGNVRELRNLIESMVVLAPGSIIRPADIPPEVRRGAERALPSLIVPSPPVLQAKGVAVGDGPPAQLPQMEFIFRTLVDLKFNVDDLRREFEMYKRRHPELTGMREAGIVEAPRVPPVAPAREPAEVAIAVEEDVASVAGEAGEAGIHFSPGMTMEELERAAIISTLKAVGGNRRRASEALGIGERTLYRKLKEYEIDV
ncbi:MAG: sigma-54 dependent transcriptional regulator [Gemmatimonadota bacterium]|jgi:DNA-binding NtrC family response regulator